jgi:uncharacterized protein (DUF1778 family)
MLKIRSRVINFRVTVEEFEILKNASARQGASCISDFARNAILEAAARQELGLHSNAASNNNEKLHSLESRLADVESMLMRLQKRPKTQAAELDTKASSQQSTGAAT